MIPVEFTIVVLILVVLFMGVIQNIVGALRFNELSRKIDKILARLGDHESTKKEKRNG